MSMLNGCHGKDEVSVLGTKIGSLGVAIWVVLWATTVEAATLVADYRFHGNLDNSVVGGPNLTYPCPKNMQHNTAGDALDLSVDGVATFKASTGFILGTSNLVAGAALSGNNYTVAVRVKFNPLSGWLPLSYGSPDNQNNDDGWYEESGKISMWNNGTANEYGSGIAQDTWFQVAYSVTPNGANVDIAGVLGTGSVAQVKLSSNQVNNNRGITIGGNDQRIVFFRGWYNDVSAGTVDRILIYQGGMTTNEMKALDLSVEPAQPPSVATSNATSVSVSSATLNGSVTSTGGASTTAAFLWDAADRGTNLTQWAHTNVVGVTGVGAVSTNLTGLTAGTTYYYILYATNSGGQSFGTNAVSFTTPAPPVATTLAASAQTLNSATLNGNVSTGTAPTTVAFLWDTTDHVGNPTQWAHTTTPVVVSAGAVASNLTGLSSSTTYYYILYATNQYGTSYGTNSEGTAHSFVTLTPTLGPSVSTAPASGQTPYAATLNGSVGSTGSAVTTVFFLYDTTDRGASQGGWAHTTTPVVVSGLGPVSASVSGLTPATTYYCLLYGTNTDGESFGTNAVAFSTLGLAPSVDTTAASGLTASGATLHGDVISTGTAPTIAYFLYDIANHGTNFALWPYSTAPLAVTGGQSLSTNLSGLPLATTYYFVLYASNSVGTAFGTPVQNFTTLALPPTIDALAATNIWSSSAAMNGNMAATNGAATTVSLYWGTNDAGAAAQGWLHTNAFGQQSAGALSTNITGLTPLTTYWYRYFATNSVGGAWSTGTTFRTAPGLIFDRASTQVVGGNDSFIANVTLPFAFKLYNVSTNKLRVGSNGAYSPKDSGTTLVDTDGSADNWHSKGYPALAILWNDMNTGPGDALGINGTYGDVASVAGVTYTNTYSITVPHAFTYRNGWSSQFTEISFQMALFATDVTVRLASGNIFAFRSGDIMYCYADDRLTAFAGGSCAVGVADGAGNYVGMPGTTAGALSSANRGLLPTNAETFVLFRPDATGTNYTSVITSFYIEPIAPTCTTAAATALTTVSATLNGSVTSTGNAPTSVYFLWGPTDQGTNVALWAHTNAMGVVAGPGAVSTNLTGLTSGATYYYIVYAVSSAGASYGLPAQSFTVPAPPVATTLAASAVTVASATLNGNVTTGTAPTTVWFLWDIADRGPDRTAWAHTNVLGVVEAGGVATNLGSLAAQSTYAYLVYATNAYGESYGTPAQSFTTLTLSTNPSVSTASATGITPYSAVLQGSVGSTGVSPTTVYFLWDTTEHGASWSAWPHATEAIITGEGAYSTNLTGLSPATTYYYLFYGSNSASESYGTNAVSFTTLGLPPTAATLAADGVSTSAATLHGTVTTGTAPTTVYFLWGPVNQGTNLGLWAHSTPPAVGVSAGSVSAGVSGLSLGATYSYVLYASNTVGAAFGTPALSVTASALAPVIDALAPTNLQPTSATMQGNLIASNGAVTSVTLYWGTHDAGAVAQGWAHTNDLGPQAVGVVATNITGLAGNTVYWYRWFATNIAGGTWSTGITFTTSHGLLFDTAPTQVQNGEDDLSVVNVTLPFDFPFFGIRTNVLRITSNGGYGLSTNAGLAKITHDSSQSPWYNTGYPVIAPLWDDLNTTPGGGTFAGLATLGGVTYSNAYVVTVPGAYAYGTGHTIGNEIQFQVALFSDRTSVALGNGHVFQFEPGDILFWYADNRLVAFEGGSCAVGIGDGTVGAGHYVGMPGTVAGVLSTADRGLLPTTGESFVLFRSTDRAGTQYSASIVSFGPRWSGSVFSFR